ncbi:MAG: STAS domain-containing protein [Bryobacteraceae bacterium]
MEISHQEIAPDVVVVTLAGKLMLGTNTGAITSLVDELLSQGKRTIIFDLTGISSIDSTGIGRFISSYNKIGSAGAEMRMAGATKQVFQAFHVSLLDTILRFYPTVEEAVRA